MNTDVTVLREVVVKLTQLLAGMSLKVTQRGTRAYVATNPKTLKPERVNIPHIPDNASPELILAIQGFIDHEVGHILHTDWALCVKATAIGEHLRGTWNILEDTYIERKQAEAFKGAGWNLRKLHEFFIAEITAPALKIAEDKGDAATMFGVLIVPICRAWSGQTIFHDYLDAIGAWTNPLIKARIDRIRPIAPKVPLIASSADSFALAEELNALMKVAPPKAKTAPKPETPEEPEEDELETDEPEDDSEAETKPEPEDGDGDAGGEEGGVPPPPKERPSKPREDDEDGAFEEDGDPDLDPLSDLERRVLTARLDRGKSFAEIAARAKRTEDEIEQAYDRAIGKLKSGFREAA